MRTGAAHVSRTGLLWLVGVVCLVVIGCRQPTRIATVHMIAGQTMGTSYAIKLVPTEGLPALEDITSEVQNELQLVNSQMSTYLVDSELSRFNRSQSTDWFEVSSDTAVVVELALKVYAMTDGAFDVTVGPLVSLWGFGPEGRPGESPSQQQIDEILAWVGSEKLQVRQDPPGLRKQDGRLQVDLSGIAKGHGVDRLAKVLDRLQVKAYFIEIGGEVRTRGTRMDGQAWQVGIEAPMEDLRTIERVLGLSDRSLATSGNYRNFYELDGRRVSHTLDPHTGRPTERQIVSASVVTDVCAQADAIATGLMSAGFDKAMALAEQHDWAVLLVKYDNGALQTAASPAFKAIFP